jgi:two-component system, LytTR family, sensor kinase
MKTIAIHLLFWALYILSEYFANLMHMRSGEVWPFLRAELLSLPALMTGTYFIALVAVPKFLKKGKWHWFVLSLVAVGAVVFFARVKWLEVVNYLEHQEYWKVPVSKVLKNIIRDYSIIALAVCIYIIGDYRRKQKLNEELAKAKAEAEIKLLKGQLHPHFLFNSLNNIYSLALMKSDLTADSILKLTELLDYLVYRANMDKVALSKEVQLLRNYVDLEKLRYGDKLKVDMDITLENENQMVAPLILLPFAENCFKHGGAGEDGFFKIKMRLKADGRQLAFDIANSKKNGRKNRHANGGVGLENIRKRLTLLYPGRHELGIQDLPEIYAVELLIELA